jgi:hypothetical protein
MLMARSSLWKDGDDDDSDDDDEEEETPVLKSARETAMLSPVPYPLSLVIYIVPL